MKYLLYFTTLFLLTSCAGTPPEGHPRASGFSENTVIIQAYNRKFVSLDSENRLVAVHSQRDSATVFHVVHLGNDIVSIQAPNELYVATDYHQENHLIAKSAVIDEWEKLKVAQSLGCSMFTSSHGTSICVNSQSYVKVESTDDSIRYLFKTIPVS